MAMAMMQVRMLSNIAVVAILACGCVAQDDTKSAAVDIIGYGILEPDSVAMRADESSTVGAKRGSAQELRVAVQTDRIPLRPGLIYGMAFVLRDVPMQEAQVRVVLRSSNPCVLKASGETVYHNDTTLTVKVGEVRHIGARIPASAEENHCVGESAPDRSTFELYLGYRKLAEKTFEVYGE